MFGIGDEVSSGTIGKDLDLSFMMQKCRRKMIMRIWSLA